MNKAGRVRDGRPEHTMPGGECQSSFLKKLGEAVEPNAGRVLVAEFARIREARVPEFWRIRLRTSTHAAARACCRRNAVHASMTRSCCAAVLSGNIGSAITERAASSLTGKSPTL